MVEINQRQKELLETEATALATVNPDGSPNVIAVGYVKVVSPTKIVITDNYMRRTNKNIESDSRVCLAVWTKDWEEGYKFAGKAKYYTTGKWVKFVKEIRENKGYPAKSAVVVEVEGIYKLG